MCVKMRMEPYGQKDGDGVSAATGGTGAGGRPESPHGWNAALYDSRLGFVSEFGKSLVDLLDVHPGEAVLDVGCGTGGLCRVLADRGAAVHGIDFSAEMIEAARAKYPELVFEVADGQSYETDRRFDAVLSNAALHWMTDPEGVVRAVRNVLVPGGRFVAEFGGKDNVGAIVAAIYRTLESFGVDPEPRNPWYFPSVGQYASLLEASGFRVGYALHYSRPTPLEDGERGMDHWLDMFGGAFFTGLTDTRKEEAYEEVKRLARPVLFREGRWVADYWRLRILAFAP